MPQIIPNIDKIAREKNRGVLFLRFDKEVFKGNYSNWAVRTEIQAWLLTNNITFLMCGDIADEGYWESYRGQLYIDLPWDETNKDYLKVAGQFEDKDGVPLINGVSFWYLPLEQAMENKHHDVVGFWEDVAENM